MRVLTAIAVSLLAPAAAGQKAAPAPTPEVSARRFARELELPSNRRAAVAGLLRLGSPAVAPLLAQAKHPDLAVARVALQTLAALEHEGLTAVPELERMAKGDDARAQAAAWTLARLPQRGTFLVPSAVAGVVYEFDDTGKEIWKSAHLGQPWNAQFLANGNLFIADTRAAGGAREYDAKGATVFEWTAKEPYTAERLIDGNTLVSVCGDQRVVEVDPRGTEVWSQAETWALHATRLPDGATLFADYKTGSVRELEPGGTVRWHIDGYENVYVAHRLRDGSTLVLTRKPAKASVVAADGKVIRELEVNPLATDVVLLPDGWIECGEEYVRRCDAMGVERWHAAITGWAGRITLR